MYIYILYYIIFQQVCKKKIGPRKQQTAEEMREIALARAAQQRIEEQARIGNFSKQCEIKFHIIKCKTISIFTLLNSFSKIELI